MNAKCFFSHSWDDSIKLKRYLKSVIEARSENRIEVILDEDDFHVSENVLNKEALIKSSDTVVVLFSPSYKEAICNKDSERGINREYKFIKERLEYDSEYIIPILYSGSRNESIPEDFNFSLYRDLTDIYVYFDKKKNKYNVGKKNRSKIIDLADLIIMRTEEKSRLKPYEFRERDELEGELYNTEATDKLPKECMVCLDAYGHILNQTCYFSVGRKGSGKSTLLEILKRYNPDKFYKSYKDLVHINAEDINLEILFSTLLNYKKDARIFPLSFLLDLFWEVYIIISCIHIVGVEAEKGRIIDGRRHIFLKVNEVFKSKLNIKKMGYDSTKKSIYTLSVELIESFIGDIIFKYATNEAYITSIKVNTTAYNILSSFFGEILFEEYLLALKRCEKRIFIGLDGFDTVSDDFCRETYQCISSNNKKDYGQDRLIFEKCFYRSLLNVIKEIKKGERNSELGIIEKIIDFCIVLPKDRLDKVETIDRDISKVKFCGLSWDAIDLLKMIVLRMEYIIGINNDGINNWNSRFNTVFSKLFDNIPTEITIEIENQKKQIDIFCYMLRLSSWNPRYIIKQMAALNNASKRAKEINSSIHNDTIKQLLARESREIIRTEFIKEYETILNIKELLTSFMNFKFSNDAKEFCSKIMQFDLVIILDRDFSDIRNRLTLLYELGIIGIHLSKELHKRQGFGNEYCFIFNEGLEPLETNMTVMSDFYREVKIIFNPMFWKYLSLDINTNDIIGDFSWEYLYKNHQRKIAVKTF